MIIGPHSSLQNRNQQVGFQKGKEVIKKAGQGITNAVKRVITVDPKIKEQTERLRRIHNGEVKPPLIIDA
ncbi:MAG: hypothetical protein A2Y25_07375 [Candidatus Melainabacteria bacterium GWF2_37_15]|nr:MAG: hypothetical protein A2Y25_07375 [Candidatus Melainabacteria bacterium GWF2_37_15]